MIRVGFRAPSAKWQGGRNYLWNLCHAIGQRSERTVQPVVLARTQADVDDYRAVAEVEAPSRLERTRLPFVIGRTAMHLAGFEVVERIAMLRADIDVYSHAPPLGKRFGAPWIYWIPDLQVARLPHLFDAYARAKYTHEIRSALDTAPLVIVSSYVTKADVCQIFGQRYEDKLRVLQFVAQPRVPKLPSREELTQRYRVPPRYIALPNQFWKHKNHALVVEALAHARDVVIVASGSTQDFRNPGLYPRLVERAEQLGVADRFRILGAIPFADVMGLVTYATGVLNPSLFEGWSTTVEEARTLGKRLVLSDIDVHREQAPPRARYFKSDDARDLAVQLDALWREPDGNDAAAADEAGRALPARTRAFAAAYEAIVHEVIAAKVGYTDALS